MLCEMKAAPGVFHVDAVSTISTVLYVSSVFAMLAVLPALFTYYSCKRAMTLSTWIALPCILPSGTDGFALMPLQATCHWFHAE